MSSWFKADVERLTDHVGFQMAAAASVDLHRRASARGQHLFGVNAARNVAFDHADAWLRRAVCQRLA